MQYPEGALPGTPVNPPIEVAATTAGDADCASDFFDFTQDTRDAWLIASDVFDVGGRQPATSIEQSADEQEQTFTATYAAYAGKVRGQILSMVSDSHMAEDLTQEVFAKLWQRWPQNEQAMREGKYSLGLVAYRVALNWLQGKKKHREVPCDFMADADATIAKERFEREGSVHAPKQPNSAEYVVLARDHSALIQALGRLDYSQAATIALVYLEGMRPSECEKLPSRQGATSTNSVLSRGRLGLLGAMGLTRADLPDPAARQKMAEYLGVVDPALYEPGDFGGRILQ